MELQDGSSDAYSDDFYDPEDHNSGKKRPPQESETNQIKELYERVLADSGDATHFEQYEFTDTFKQHQEKVQNAYGPESEIYKTLNPKHS